LNSKAFGSRDGFEILLSIFDLQFWTSGLPWLLLVASSVEQAGRARPVYLGLIAYGI